MSHCTYTKTVRRAELIVEIFPLDDQEHQQIHFLNNANAMFHQSRGPSDTGMPDGPRDR